MNAAETFRACLEIGDEASWRAFVARFQPLLAASIARVVMRYGPANPALTDDLVQETYLRLCRDNCRVLHSFEARHDEAIFGYLKVIATSVALDHFRGRATLKRRAEVAEGPGQPEASASAAAIEQAALLKQLEQHLAASESERDRSIF